MPNHCENILRFHQYPAGIEEFFDYTDRKEIYDPEKTNEFHTFDMKIFPPPNYEWDYTWCSDNWNSKWGAYEACILEHNLSFTSAWAPPEGLMFKLCHKLQYSAALLYYEPGSVIGGYFLIPWNPLCDIEERESDDIDQFNLDYMQEGYELDEPIPPDPDIKDRENAHMYEHLKVLGEQHLGCGRNKDYTDKDILTKANPRGWSVAHSQAFYTDVEDEDLHILQDEFGTSVAHIRACKGFFTEDPRALMLTDKVGCSVIKIQTDLGWEPQTQEAKNIVLTERLKK